MRSAILKLLSISVLAAMFGTTFGQSSDYKTITRLSGYWKFSVGDNLAWSKPGYDDSDWDQIYVPAEWEKSGYDEYNGYAWYRKTFEYQGTYDFAPLFLLLGKIDDVDEVFLNGKKIGSSGNFPPDYVSAYNDNRKYIIPEGLLHTNGKNTIAVRVYDDHSRGGIYTGNIGIFYDATYALMDIPLEGLWKFKTGNRREWKDETLDDSKWGLIMVPASWESQGYPNYDGYACYRKHVVIPKKYEKQPLYISLGRIDDIDDVYFNGTFIGNVYDLKGQSSYRWKGQEHMARRVYYIPKHLIKFDKNNVIAVVVYDIQQRGGIYEGPVGIMTEENYKTYKRNHENQKSFWDYILDWISY